MVSGDSSYDTAKEFMEFDRVIFGKIEDVTDKDAYTVSFELPEECEIQEKIKVESEYHELTNGGHITEIKSKNVYDTLKKVSESEIGFVKIINIAN